MRLGETVEPVAAPPLASAWSRTRRRQNRGGADTERPASVRRRDIGAGLRSPLARMRLDHGDNAAHRSVGYAQRDLWVMVTLPQISDTRHPSAAFYLLRTVVLVDIL
jgi:hypothetical protein